MRPPDQPGDVHEPHVRRDHTLRRQRRGETIQPIDSAGSEVELPPGRILDYALDPAWADDNIGPYIHETFGYDITYVIDRDDRIRYCVLDGVP